MVIFYSFLYVYQRVSWGALKNMYSRFFALQLERLAPQIRWFWWAQGPWPGADCLRVELRAQHSAATWSSDWNLKTWKGLEWHDPPCIAGTKHVSEINSDKWYILSYYHLFFTSARRVKDVQHLRRWSAVSCRKWRRKSYLGCIIGKNCMVDLVGPIGFRCLFPVEQSVRG